MLYFRKIVFLIALVSVFSIVSAQDSDAEVVDRIIAVVDGKAITLFDINEEMAPILAKVQGVVLSAEEQAQLQAIRGKILKKMVEDILLQNEIDRYGLEVSDEALEADVKALQERTGMSDEDFENKIKETGMTRDKLLETRRKSILQHQLLGSKVRQRVVVTDTELIKAYHEWKRGGGVSAAAETLVPVEDQGKKVRLRLIIVPSDISAKELREKIDDGDMTFAEAADEYSNGPGAGQGGDLGLMAWSDMSDLWKMALEGVSKGEMTKPFRIQEFEALLLLEDIQEAKTKEELEAEAEELQEAEEDEDGDKYAGVDMAEFEAMKGEFHEALYKAKFDKVFSEYMDKLRENAIIEYK